MMKLISYFRKGDDLGELYRSGVTELILGYSKLSRLGDLEWSELLAKAHEARELGMKVMLEWDILQTESDFRTNAQFLSTADLSCFSLLRVQDMGAFHFALKNLNLPLHLILETAHHNFEAIEALLDYGKERISRVTLSLELPQEVLSDFCSKLKDREIEIEFLGLGPILLFYTPRKLLSIKYFDHDEDEVQVIHQKPPLMAQGRSEESPHSGFTVIENRHGTFMFNTKDHCVLENLPELKNMGIDYLRIDNRLGMNTEILGLIANLLNDFSSSDVERIKELYGRKVIRGFYNANRTDRLFPKLKNQRIKRDDSDYIGEVIEAQKDEAIGILIKSKKKGLKIGDALFLKTPEGKEKKIIVHQMKNSKSQGVNEAHYHQLVFIPWVGGVSKRTMVYGA